MKKLTVENINAYIESVRTDKNGERAVKMPRSITYPEQIYIDMNKVIDTRDEFKDLFRQHLAAFSAKKTDFPAELLYYLGEKDEKGQYIKWTERRDDTDRFMTMALYTQLFLHGEKKTVIAKGKEFTSVFFTISDEEIKPIIIKY